MNRFILAAGVLATLATVAANAANTDVTVGFNGMNAYNPSILTVSVGDTVTFHSVSGFHNVRSDVGAVTTFRCANGCDGTGGNGAPAAAGWTAVVTLNATGSVPFFCEVHGQIMSGTITVTTPVSLQSFDID